MMPDRTIMSTKRSWVLPCFGKSATDVVARDHGLNILNGYKKQKCAT